MRIEKHPILDFARGKKVKFTFDGREITGHEGETITAALVAAGVLTLSKSIKLERPRGFFCGIGRCSSCYMVVNGVSNVRACVTPLEKGMDVNTQVGRGEIASC
ncbi:MAG: (2Fe-2S)-binding protein [Planctomycetota bacterium]|nr:MAG: (2Fe-2S)-binding protein [Planctomycetota bacterium]